MEDASHLVHSPLNLRLISYQRAQIRKNGLAREENRLDKNQGHGQDSDKARARWPACRACASSSLELYVGNW